jgi:subtilase family serine protease
MNRLRRRALRPTVDRLDDRLLLSGLSPAQLTHAYGLDAIGFAVNGQAVKGDGSGQTIALIGVDHDPYLASDLHTFDTTYGLPDPSLTQIDMAGGKTDDGWAEEATLDVEWAHAIAPGANLVVVEARSANISDLVAAVDVARGIPSVSVISMSLGGAEFSGQVASDAHFTTPAGHIGITFVAASGDDGLRAGAQWPASSSNVVAVAGTSLAVAADGTYLGEALWSGSSGGKSRYESEPVYQRGVQSTGRRTTPDVAFVADPATGVAVYTTEPSSGVGVWQVFGGTSVGTPAWSAIIAIANQGRATAGLGTLDGRSQTLPLLYSLPASAFHKIAGAGNASHSVTTVGRGSPVGPEVVNGLAFGVTTTGTASARARARANKAVARRAAAVVPAAPIGSRHLQAFRLASVDRSTIHEA